MENVIAIGILIFLGLFFVGAIVAGVKKGQITNHQYSMMKKGEHNDLKRRV